MKLNWEKYFAMMVWEELWKSSDRISFLAMSHEVPLPRATEEIGDSYRSKIAEFLKAWADCIEEGK